MAKVILFEVRIDGTDTIINNQKQLRQAILATNKALDGADIGSDRYKELQRNLGALKKIQADVREETRRQGREFVRATDQGRGSYRALQAELTNLKKEFKGLGAEARNSLGGRQLLNRIGQLDGELRKIDRTLGESFRNIGNYQSAFSGAFSAIRGGLLAAGIGVGLQEISRAVVASVGVFADFKDQLALLGTRS